jgi:acyl transferase domain-containing protein/NAD(P)-dependent dehydrogenase (short-subunit alcohol dehydrogenase family)
MFESMSEADSAATMHEPLAVIGLSCLFPQAADPSEFWSNLRRGVDAISEIPPTHWNPDAYYDPDPKTPDKTYARRGGFLAPVEFDPLEYGIAPSNLEAIDTSQLLGLVAAKRALEDAGYGSHRQFDRSRVGCILGVTGTLELVIPLGARLGHPKWRQALKEAGVAEDVAEDVIRRISESYVPWQENSFPGLLGNVVAGRIANRLDLGGTNCVVDAACASSLSALHLAALELWSGRSDMVITGGVDTFNDIFMYMCFSKTPALSPTGDARPFADNADGTILSEGVGMFVLKRLSDARRAGDRIDALILGIGTSSDGAGNAVYAPKKEGQVRCLQDAYRVAGVSPGTVELIEAHGTGTKVGDATELAGLTDVFRSSGRTGRWCAVGSVKSQIGHTKAAAGAAGLLKAILALKHRVLPPTIKVDRPLPALRDERSPLYVNTAARPWLPSRDHPRRAGVSAFGFGGSNFHCVLEESPSLEPGIDWDQDVFFAAWSADSREELADRLRAWKAASNRCDMRRGAAQARREFRASNAYRLVIVAEARTADVARLVATALDSLAKYADRPHWSTPDGIVFGSGPRSGKLGMLFPGQGSQYVGMQRELACRFPALQSVLAEANEVFADFAAPADRGRLSDYIYPPPAFDDATQRRQEEALRDTEIAQPALGAVCLGLLAVLSDFGVRPEVVAGHSYGELTALCASKRFAPAALYRLSMLRGKLMAEAQEVEGGMLAVGAPQSQVEAALKEAAVDLVIANRNSPTQVVLSGRVSELERVHDVLARRNIRGKRLPVAAAFHSPLVASASRRFRPVLEEIEFAAPEVPVYANSNAGEYPPEPDAARSMLAGQLAQPVEFVRQIENMYEAGVRQFLEVGPGNVLTGLVQSILAGREFRAVAIDATSGKRSGMLDLASALGHLAAAGYPVDLPAWDPGTEETNAQDVAASQRLTIPLCGANYVRPRDHTPPRERARENPAPAPQAKTAIVVPRDSSDLRSRPHTSEAQPAAVTRPDAPPSSAGNPQPAPASAALSVLQQMFEQTARLHRQFLEGQEAALRTLEGLTQAERREQGAGIRNQGSEEGERVAGKDTRNRTGHREQTAVNALDNERSIASPPMEKPRTIPPQPPSTKLPPQLTSVVLAVVAEKTGYPAEMLKPEMSLDHDLGIDSIKRVEILSALQERRPDLPSVQPEQLGTLHRLSDVISLLSATSSEGGLEREETQRAAGGPLTQDGTSAAGTGRSLTLGIPTATPYENAGDRLRLPLGATLFVTDDGGELSRRIVQRLNQLGYRAQSVAWDASARHSVPDDLAGLILVAPDRGTNDDELWHALEWTQLCGAALRRTGRSHAAVLATISRLDGRFGLGGSGPLADPLSGALAGLAKTVRHEWPEVSAKAVDLSPGAADLNALVEHLLSAGPVEAGIAPDRWWQVDVQDATVPDDGSPPVAPGDLVVVTGGARGVTAAAALAAAKAWRPRLLLCGRTSVDETEPHWLADLETAAQIKHALAQRGPAGQSLRQIDELTKHVLAGREIRATLAAIRELGVDVDYLAVDIRDAAAVERCLREFQRRHGPIRGVIHGAGVLEDRRIEDKTRPQFENVFSTKIVGLRNLLNALVPDELRFLALFSSFTGRFGRTGQVDYAMANEALNKLARQFQASWPQCRVRSFNWGPWDGGMVTDSLKPLFAREGVGLIPLADGAKLLVDELERASSSTVELVVLAQVERSTPHAVAAVTTHDVVPTTDGAGHPSASGLTDVVLAVVAEKTGYPPEMLKPEMSLDHDLGIDSIKRVEILSALQECRPDLPVVQPDQLGALHRLADVIALLAKGAAPDREQPHEARSTRDEGGLVPEPTPHPSLAPSPPTPGRCGWERVVDVAGHPYLESHVIGGKAVLPTAMIVECLAHAALHHHPGLEFVGLSDLRVFKGVRLNRSDQIRLRGLAEKGVRSGGEFRVPTRLVSRADDGDALHAQANILLSAARPSAANAERRSPTASPLLTPPSSWYDTLLFHGPQFQGILSIDALSDSGIDVRARTAPPPAEWLADPWRSAWLADPLALDAALQALIVWTRAVCGAASLPTAIGEYRQFRSRFPADEVRIAVRARRRNEGTVDAQAEFRDPHGDLVATLSGIEYVVDGQLADAFLRNRLA